MIETIKKDDELIAIIIRSQKWDEGLHFFTPNESPLQIGIHHQPKNHHIEPHAHIPFDKELIGCCAQEIFIIKSGSVSIGLWSKDDKYVKRVTLNRGDVILLEGGHSVTFLEDTTLVEVKQGIYRGKQKEKRMILK